jgi:hypothetical protein
MNWLTGVFAREKVEWIVRRFNDQKLPMGI